MLNIASVNMPKIKPETKVLIIKNLKSKCPAEFADIFNVSKRQVERIRKRYQETGDVHDRPSSGNCSRRQLAGPTVKSQAHGHQRRLFCQELYVGFLLAMVSTVLLLPILLPRNQR